MKECDNSTRKIHISNNFILSVSLLIMFDTLLLRPSLHYSPPLHFTTLHPTTLHCTSLHFTTLHPATLHCTLLHFTTLHPTTLHPTTLHHISPNFRNFAFSHLHFTTLLFSPTLPGWLWSPHSLVVSMYCPSSLGIKQPGRQPNKSHVSSAEVMMLSSRVPLVLRFQLNEQQKVPAVRVFGTDMYVKQWVCGSADW
jgi:hypothetical protein